MGDGFETMSKSDILDGFREMREYIEFGHAAILRQMAEMRTKILTEMRAGFAQVDRRFARLDDRVSALEDDMSQVKLRLDIVG
ncbi:hypothetical protein EPN42_02650 [bacterium]|nr:MAG: hypothetical protein EPN42_02650 [bacterium]